MANRRYATIPRESGDSRRNSSHEDHALEAEVRANDLELDEPTAPEEARDMADDEAQPGKGENAPGFLKRRKS